MYQFHLVDAFYLDFKSVYGRTMEILIMYIVRKI